MRLLGPMGFLEVVTIIALGGAVGYVVAVNGSWPGHFFVTALFMVPAIAAWRLEGRPWAATLAWVTPASAMAAGGQLFFQNPVGDAIAFGGIAIAAGFVLSRTIANAWVRAF